MTMNMMNLKLFWIVKPNLILTMLTVNQLLFLRVNQALHDQPDNSNHANAECVVETKPYGNCLTINCDLAKLHPSPHPTPILDHGVYKCVKCGVQHCAFCVYDSEHMRKQWSTIQELSHN